MLKDIKSPAQLHSMKNADLNALAGEIRDLIVSTVTENGGHLSSNLGVVELTLALHAVFDSPNDKIVFDVGHQAYAHKLLTGRYAMFSTLRRKGGISGFPRVEESEHDAFTAGHASTALSAALGIARSRDLMGDDFAVVAVVGDGALTGGMCYEALNDAGQSGTRLIVVLNDNEMSISKNVGAMSAYLTLLRQSGPYRSVKRGVRSALDRIPVVGPPVMRIISKGRDALRGLFVDGQFFEALGFDYLGPVDGHDIRRLKKIFARAKKYDKPVLIHVVTQKGRGYAPAEAHPDLFHGVSPTYYTEGKNTSQAEELACGKAMAAELCEMARTDIRIAAITAAMPQGTGLTAFQKKYPDRFYDVGIAEEHAVTMAAGMAFSGMRPYVALYSTFSQRAFDQLTEDVCLPKMPVTLLLDRAGLVGPDGATHQGAFDLTFLRLMPNMIVASPRDVRDLRRLLRLSAETAQPMAIRYAKEAADMGAGMQEREPLRVGEWELLLSGGDVMLLALGRMVELALRTAIELNGKGVSCGVIDARFVKPMDDEMLRTALTSHRLIVTMEENSVIGGFGAGVLEKMALWDIRTRVMNVGLPDRFIAHGTVAEQMEACGFTPDALSRDIIKKMAREG